MIEELTLPKNTRADEQPDANTDARTNDRNDTSHQFSFDLSRAAHRNLTTAQLYEEILRRGEGTISEHGALVVDTGEHTGRSPKDKAIVREDSSAAEVWWGEVNKEISQSQFNVLRDEMKNYAREREVFVQDLTAGADARYQLKVQVITELAWHSLFARNLLIRDAAISDRATNFTIIDLPGFQAQPEVHGTRSQTFILLDFSQRLVLIGGTSYAGEIKKSVFTILNYLLPKQGVMSMHCSANVATDDPSNVAVFFGLSGTGKTTLSADPERLLIGDDEHGWSNEGVFNYEGGCYAKVIRLSPEAEPDIYRTTRMFGTILENVLLDSATRKLDLDDATKTENTRAAYPLESIPNIVTEGKAGHPKNIIMLTADAFGVMPPIARLTPEQAMYHFLSGYTAKIAGTEKGLGNEPQATFSTCFGAPFMVHHPSVYADLLGKKIAEHNATCWLVNTGWSGGAANGAGQRMKIAYTRAMIRHILNGELEKVETRLDPTFGIAVPVSCPDVPTEVLTPRNTWADKEAYDAAARDLAQRFNDNFKKYAAGVSDAVKESAPKL